MWSLDLLNYVTLEQLWNERTSGLFLNSVMHLSLEQQIVCRRDLELLELCIKDTEHRFYREMLINAMQTAILDFSIFMLVSMMKATFQRRCLHHTSFLENAGGWYIPRTQGGILLCRLFVHYVEILVGSVKRWADMPPTIGLTVIQYLIFHACCVISHCRSCRFPICSASRHKPISAVMYNRISVSIRRSTEHKSIQSDVTDDSW